MLRFLLLCLSASIPITVLLVPVSSAQSGSGSELSVSISGPKQVIAGHTVVLEAAAAGAQGDIAYTWYQEPLHRPIGTISQVLFAPRSAGTFTIRVTARAMVGKKPVEATTQKNIRVLKRKVTLLVDSALSKENIDNEQRLADANNVLLQVVQPHISTVTLTGQEVFSQAIGDRFPAFADSDAIVILADPMLGIQSLVRAVGSDPQRIAAMRSTSVIVASNATLSTLSRSLKGPASVLRAQRMILTRPTAVPLAIGAENMLDFEAQLLKRGIEAAVQDTAPLAPRPWNLLSVLTVFLLAHGVSMQTVILLLMLPVIATILAFLRQVVGLTTFGLFTPSVIALSFLSLGWSLGILFLLWIVGASFTMRMLIRKWRLLYVPKMAIVLVVVSLAAFLLVVAGAGVNIVFAPETVFILLIMSTLSESLLEAKIEEGWISALQAIVQTVIAALIAIFVISLPVVQSSVLAYPDIILFTLVINFLLGRYTGLRLTEYLRFRAIFEHLQE